VQVIKNVTLFSFRPYGINKGCTEGENIEQKPVLIENLKGWIKKMLFLRGFYVK